MCELDTAEQQAVNDFLANHWAAFVRASKDFLTEEECDRLAEKLANQNRTPRWQAGKDDVLPSSSPVAFPMGGGFF